MLAILGGLGAAFAFAGSTLCSSRSSRLIPPASVVAWVMAVGLVAVTPFLVVEGVPSGLDAGAVAWFAIAGVGNVGGLLVAYAALRIADVGLVAPILSTQGAIAALIAVAAGEHLGAASAVALVVIALGVVLSATAPGSVATEDARPRRAVALASTAALVFGVGLYAIGRVGADLSVAWAVLPPRLVGVVCVAAPLALAGRLRLTRAAAPLVVVGGLCEVGRLRLHRRGLPRQHRDHRRALVPVRRHRRSCGGPALRRAPGPGADRGDRHHRRRHRRPGRPPGVGGRRNGAGGSPDDSPPVLAA